MAEEKKRKTNQATDAEETVSEEAETDKQEEAEEIMIEEASGDAEETAEAADAPEEKTKKSRKKAKADKKDEQIRELNDRLLRNMAEFDNFRKRTDREKEAMFGNGQSAMIVKILPVLDDMERGLAALSEEEKGSSVGQGLEMICKKLSKILEDAGVTPIEAEGKPFDPALHNAVMQQESEEFESGTVIKELQKGYMFRDQVIRYSMVMVAQ